jgi:anthranilate/para-aminobenzoate synthase component II
MIKAYLCDFEDSFTYNIYSELSELKFIESIDVVQCRDIAGLFSDLVAYDSSDQVLVVLGPGPGHPNKYNFLMEQLNQLFLKDNVILFGICLGHQLMAKCLGFQIKSAIVPLHGKVEHLRLDSHIAARLSLDRDIFVQRYNSLVPIFKTEHSEQLESYFQKKDELLIILGKNFLGYQFHPESVGTSCPSSFFTTLKRFLI